MVWAVAGGMRPDISVGTMISIVSLSGGAALADEPARLESDDRILFCGTKHKKAAGIAGSLLFC